MSVTDHPHPSPAVVVVGSANIDLLVRVASHPGPGETLLAHDLTRRPGGKGANQAVAAARLGAAVTFVGAVGQDAEGRAIVAALDSEGVATDVQQVSGVPSGLAVVTIDDAGENSIIVVAGANAEAGATETAAAAARALGPHGVVVVQGELALDATLAGLAAARGSGARAVVNLAPFWAADAETLAQADPLVVNETEARQLLAHGHDDGSAAGLEAAEGALPDAALEAARRLASTSRSVVVTLGAAGAVWADQTGAGHVAADRAPAVVDTTGAGDAFVGALAAALAAGSNLAAAVERGVRAGTFAVGALGAQTSYPRSSDLA